MENIFKIGNNCLDIYQKDIVLDNSDALLVVAGAGSGKTFTILGKIKYLIEIRKINPNQILCISLTNDTVKNLKNKLINLGYDIDVYTFHKLGLKILNNQFRIVSEDYLDFIIDEYFLSYIFSDNKKKKRLYNYLKIPLWTNLLSSKEYLNLKNTIISATNLIKSNNYSLEKVCNIYTNSIINRKIFKYIVDIFVIYKRELDASFLIDFNDMINLAANASIKLDYKYIIIDEYQDTSYSRYALIKSIQNKCNAKVIAVGDDWQSIYRFTGCEIDIFINFNNFFNNARIMYLKNTYRNSCELIKVASEFIMKNPFQIKKTLFSNKSLEKPIKIVYNLINLNKLIEYINKDDLLILGRNNYDICKYKLDYNVQYLTVHKSKGLEAEEVILINLENKLDGFPNKKKDNIILTKIKKDKKLYPYDEERRLFYVALTRTKNCIYLVVDKHKKSIFVKELIKDYRQYLEFLDI